MSACVCACVRACVCVIAISRHCLTATVSHVPLLRYYGLSSAIDFGHAISVSLIKACLFLLKPLKELTLKVKASEKNVTICTVVVIKAYCYFLSVNTT